MLQTACDIFVPHATTTMMGEYHLAWYINTLYLVVHFAMSVMVVHKTTAGRVPPIYWNSSNPIFGSSNSDNVVSVHIMDTVEIFCPTYKLGNPQRHEYYIVNMVSKQEYKNCVVYNRTRVRTIITCNKPTAIRTNKMVIYEFTPIPSLPDFIRGCDYYLITTSSGTREGLTNQYLGACERNNMRMIIRVKGKSNKSCKDDRPIPKLKTTRSRSTKHTTKSTRRPTAKPRITSYPRTTQRKHLTNTPKETVKVYSKPPVRTRTRDKMPKLIRPSSINTGVINATSSTQLPALTFPLLLVACTLSYLTLCR